MNSRKVIIVINSVAQVPAELVHQLNIRVVSSILLLDAKYFLDGGANRSF